MQSWAAMRHILRVGRAAAILGAMLLGSVGGMSVAEARAKVDSVELKPGQLWLYQTRSREPKARILIQRVERHEKLGEIAAQPGAERRRALRARGESATRKHHGTTVLPTMSTGASDKAQVRSKGVHCYGIDPATDAEDAGKGFGAHSDQERTLESELLRFGRFYQDVVFEIARAR
jgi:hypothetical protein